MDSFFKKLFFILRILVGGIFFYSGFTKLIEPSASFEIAMSFYQIIPPHFIHPIAVILPWVELILGAFLILGYLLAPTAIALICLTALFQLILGQALVRRLDIDECGCFGGNLIHLTLYQSFILDTALLLILIQIVTTSYNILTLDNYLYKPPKK
jgi:uncharacterized membrane protein YphA (DoxX/SURF4 family)